MIRHFPETTVSQTFAFDHVNGLRLKFVSKENLKLKTSNPSKFLFGFGLGLLNFKCRVSVTSGGNVRI